MKKLFAFSILAFGVVCHGQAWSPFLDPTRAIDWTTGVGFTIPNFTVNCATQPSLATGSGNAGANATSIQSAITSCDATHNVVNIPSGTWYYTTLSIQKSNVVIRGAGANSTTIIPTVGYGCAGGITDGTCAVDPNDLNYGSTEVLPGGANACSWTAGYTKGTTSITLSSCANAPPNGSIIDLDQANDPSDNGGVYICDNQTNCSLEGGVDGRIISGVTHSQQQFTKITGVASLGGGSYTVTISPGVYFTNIRSGQSPGAFWFETITKVGIENLTIDGATMSSGSPTDFGNMGFYQCYQCWVKGVRSENAGRHHVATSWGAQNVVRDSYFYGALGGHTQSYGIELMSGSGQLVENNILQQTTAPIMVTGTTTGSVVAYNFAIQDYYVPDPMTTYWAQSPFYSHSAGNEMNLWEGNNFVTGPVGDDVHGSSTQITLFRNMSPGWYAGKTNATQPFIARALVRGMNIIGGVYGQPGYHDTYETYPTSTSSGAGVNVGKDYTTIYTLGWPDDSDVGCTIEAVTNGCDLVVRPTLMRWGNYDVVTAGTKFDSTEASPGAVIYMSANFSSSYFNTLAHTLPASLYYSSTPSWWTSGKAFPPVGPDVSSGNVGVCTGGTYAGAQATSSGQCTGGTLSTAWASHVTSIPAEDCFLTTMSGPPDGTGSVLAFNASTCYTIAPPASPTPGSAILTASNF